MSSRRFFCPEIPHVARLPRLTLAFLQRQPESAARALEVLAPEDAAAVLAQVPVRISVPVFAAMTSVAAARCAANLPAGTVAAVCEALPGADAYSLLRHLDDAERLEVFERLPGKVSRRIRRALDYAEGTVGAWVEQQVPALNQNRTVADARHLLGHLDDFSASHLPLVDDAQKYAGLLPISALLRASPNARLETLAWRDCMAVTDTSLLASAAGRDDWDESTLLPVVNHRGELLGGVTKKTLAKVIREQTSHEVVRHESVLAYLLAAYLVAAEGLLKILLTGNSSTGSTPIAEDS